MDPDKEIAELSPGPPRVPLDAKFDVTEGETPFDLGTAFPPTLVSDKPIADDYIDRKALWSLSLQHLSSSWGARCFEFAAFLYFINIFPNTLFPVSLYGFFTTGTAILGAGAVGGLVASVPRLRFVRLCIVLQKATVTSGYALFLILFLEQGRISAVPKWIIYAGIVIVSSVLNLVTIAISVSIERDWVTIISDGSSTRLTRLNTYLRRIDLIAKLVAPLYVSLLTTAASYSFSAAFLLGFALLSMVFEFVWIAIVYRRLPILATEEEARNVERKQSRERERASNLTRWQKFTRSIRGIPPALRQAARDWKDFIASPVFPSSLAISLLYLTVLSFDGTMLSYLITHNYSTAFLAGMRGLCVVTGLLGTVGMPWLEKKIGVVRAGSWSVLSEVVTLIPVLLSFFVGAPADGEVGVGWNSALLFTGMALSRVGLWSFDLCQLKELQTTLQDHPRRNQLTSLQYSLQNMFDLLKYILTIILSSPSQFKWAALVSFIAVCLGAVSYLYYARAQRGHLLHYALIRKET